jgi:hypothetical protein
VRPGYSSGSSDDYSDGCESDFNCGNAFRHPTTAQEREVQTQWRETYQEFAARHDLLQATHQEVAELEEDYAEHLAELEEDYAEHMSQEP